MTVAKKVAMFDLVDQLLVDYQKPEDLIGEHEPAQATHQGRCGACPAS